MTREQKQVAAKFTNRFEEALKKIPDMEKIE